MKFSHQVSDIITRKMKSRNKLLQLLPQKCVCLEIGVWKGEFSKEIISTLSPKILYLIDPWKYIPEYKNRWYGGSIAKSQKDMDQIYKEVKNKYGGKSNIKIIRKYSHKAVNGFKNNSFDFVYIDGNHSFDYVLQDLELYFPKVKKGGIIAGDDYFSIWGLFNKFEVKRAVDKFASKNRVRFLQKDSQFVLKKL